MDFELELVWIPVSDVDRAKRFYLEQAGFDLLVDIPNGLPGHRIVQVTPPGSACSIGFGNGLPPPSPARSRGCSWSPPIIKGGILGGKTQPVGADLGSSPLA